MNPSRLLSTICAVVLCLCAPARAELGNVLGWATTDVNQLTFTCQFGVVRIDLLDEQVARFRARSTNGAFEAENDSFTVVQDWPRPAYTVTGTNPIELATYGLRIEVGPTPFRVTYKRTDGTTYLTDAGTPSVVFSIVNSVTQRFASFTMPAGEQYYGLGMVLGQPFSYRGQSRTLYNARSGFASGAMGDMAVPLLVSSSNYGVFVDNTYRQVWDLNQFTSTQWRVRTDSGELDYYFLGGSSRADVLDHYTKMTGRAPMPPRWTMGYMQSRYGYKNWTEVNAARLGFRTNDLPLDAMILDLYWFGNANQMGALKWNLSAFPQPATNIAALRTNGINLITIHEQYINKDNQPARSNYLEAAALKALLTDDAAGNTPSTISHPTFFGSAVMPDFLNPAGRAWFFDKLRPEIDDGVAAHWTDLGEPELDDTTDWLSGGHREAEIHNVYNLLWHQALAEGYAQYYPNQRLYLLSRSGFAGDQRYGAAHWSNDVGADEATLQAHQNAICNYGMSGMSLFGSDIGGFTGTPTDELYVRWFQFGAFCPVFRAHGVDSKPTAPNEFSAYVTDHCRNLLKLRYRLLPYLYTAARETHETGLPICRALPLQFPDQNTTNITLNGTEFMFGPSILVSPVASVGITSRWTYLPAGQWVEHTSGNLLNGGQVLPVAPTPIGEPPIYFRMDSILPLGPYVDATAFDDGSNRALRVYVDTAATGTLYEDDGSTMDYTNGAFATTAFAATRVSNVVTIVIGPAAGSYDGQPETRAWDIELYCTNTLFSVIGDGTPLDAWSDWPEAQAGGIGYYLDAAEDLLRIRLPPAPLATSRTVVVYLDPDAPPPFERRINAGGRPYLDRAGLRWTDGGRGFSIVGGTTSTIYAAIADTEDDRLFQSERYGANVTARFACVNGAYRVDVLNAENYWAQAAYRVFNIYVEGQAAFTNYDIVVAAGGANRATTATTTGTVADAQLDVSFRFVSSVSSEQSARLSALRVRKLADPDADGDGIPDWWATRYFGHADGQTNDLSLAMDDADEDGIVNADEYKARTNPTLPASRLSFTQGEFQDDGTLRVAWATVPGKRYRLLRSDDGEAWAPLVELVASASETMFDLPADGENPRFSVEVLP